jgi:hypothetical protein
VAHIFKLVVCLSKFLTLGLPWLVAVVELVDFIGPFRLLKVSIRLNPSVAASTQLNLLT